MRAKRVLADGFGRVGTDGDGYHCLLVSYMPLALHIFCGILLGIFGRFELLYSTRLPEVQGSAFHSPRAAVRAHNAIDVRLPGL